MLLICDNACSIYWVLDHTLENSIRFLSSKCGYLQFRPRSGQHTSCGSGHPCYDKLDAMWTTWSFWQSNLDRARSTISIWNGGQASKNNQPLGKKLLHISSKLVEGSVCKTMQWQHRWVTRWWTRSISKHRHITLMVSEHSPNQDRTHLWQEHLRRNTFGILAIHLTIDGEASWRVKARPERLYLYWRSAENLTALG